MKSIISLLLLITLFLWIFTIYFTEKKKFRVVEYNRGERYLLSRNMYFIIFTVCTAPMFLIPYALLKYGLWFGVMLFLLFSGRIRLKLETTMIIYMVFFFWLCFAMTYTSKSWQGTMMLVKYSLPLLFLYLSYSSLENDKDLIIFLKVVNAAVCIYCLFMGGFAMKFIPILYYSFSLNIFATYAPFADFLAALFIVPIILYWLTKDKKYIYCALWMVLSTVLQSVRTGIGAMVLVFMFAMFLRYKSRSLPGIIFAGVVFLGVILYVPSVNQKFFGENAGTVTGEDIVQGNALSLDKIETSGREKMWESAKENLYYGHELIGKGLGEAEYYCKHLYFKEKEAKMHNDYLVLLCDTGNIGVGLLILFYAVVLLKVFAHVVLRKSNVLVKITGIMALSSMAGIAFCMYFDNVVSNSMQSMIIPYIFLGFFLKALDIEGKNKRTLAILRFRKERE